MLGPSSFGFWLGPRRGTSVSTPYPEPLSISPRETFFYPGVSSGLVGWDGEARGPAAAPSHHTHNYGAAFSLAQRSAFALEPNAVARPAVRHDAADDDTQQTGTTKQTTAAEAAARKRAAQQQRQSAARQDRTNRTPKGKQGRTRKGKRSSTTNDSAGYDGGGAQQRAATDTPLGVSYTRRKERHRPQPEWHAGHILTRLT